MGVGLDVGQRDVDFGVFQLVVLIEASLTAVRFGAGPHCALVVSLNLIGIPAHPLALFVVAVTVAGVLVVLISMRGTSYLLSRLTS